MKKKLKQLSKNKNAVGIFCIGVAICLTVVNMNLGNKKTGAKTTTIIITTTEIDAGDKITESMISEVKLEGNIPSNVITSKEDILGKYANIKITENDIITEEKLSIEAIYGSAYLENLADDERAISVSLSSLAVGVSGKLESGDIISIINTDEYGDTCVLEDLRYVEVIAISDSSGYEVGSTQNNTSAKNVGSTITLLVNEKQAETLANLEKTGNIHLALVYRGNDEKKQELLEKQAEVLQSIYPNFYEETTDDIIENLTEEDVEILSDDIIENSVEK